MGSAPAPRLRTFEKNIRKPPAVYCCEFASQTSALRNPKTFRKRFEAPILLVLNRSLTLVLNVRHGGRFERLAAPLRKFIILSPR